MRGIKKICVLLIACMLCLLGCSSDEGASNYVAKMYELSEEEMLLVSSPSAEYVMAALHQLEHVVGIEQDPEVGEGGLKAAEDEECIARIFFTSSLVDQSGFEEEKSTLEKGTTAGGSIDIYSNVEDAITRDRYLHEFDDSQLFNPGSHAIAGTIVIRTSKELDEEDQIAFTDSIVASLVSGEITEDAIELALTEIADEEAMRAKLVQEKSGTEEETKTIEELKIEVGVDSVDFIDMRYDEIAQMLRGKGFINIVENQTVIEFDLHKDLKCTEISINGDREFSATDKYNPEDEIIITYYRGAMAKSPDNWMNLLEKHYKDVEKQFKDAGFTNITCVAHEIDYDTNSVFEGSVVNIAVGPSENCTFEKNEEWYTNTEIRIDYRVKPIQTPEPTLKPTPVPEKNNGNSGGGTGVTVPEHEEAGGNLVWVPTNGGKKYHSRSGCSNMKNPMQVTLDTAIANGYTACKKCY